MNEAEDGLWLQQQSGTSIKRGKLMWNSCLCLPASAAFKMKVREVVQIVMAVFLLWSDLER